MTATPSPQLYRNRLFPWIMLLLGLVIGYFIGRTTMATAVAGDCVNPRDTFTVASNVSQASCKKTCPTCMWVQND